MDQPSSRARNASPYLAEDTIAAISSAVGGAIALIRLSGPRAHSAALALCATKQPELQRLPVRLATRVTLNAPRSGAPLDDVVLIAYTEPASFTGEDVVELCVHGGAYGCSRILEALLAEGARQALPGEFSFRAVKNGKLSLSQALAIPDLISAKNDNALELALEKLSGAQNAHLRALSEDLTQLATLSELGIDFSDQNVPEVSIEALQERARSIDGTLASLSQSFARGSRIQEGIRVAIVGRPNAGKSSFFNALLGEDRSIVSDIPGTTRDIVRESLTLRTARGSATLRIEDTAGLRRSDDTIEREGIARSRDAAARADLVLWLVDPTSAEADAAELRALASNLALRSEQLLFILTKSDRSSASQVEAARSLLQELYPKAPVTNCTVQNPGGLDVSIELLLEQAQRFLSRAPGEVLLTRVDQLRAVEAAREHLARALQADAEDLFAADIRQALHALEPLLGHTDSDAILGKIFSDFCIGK